jgi:hypothetical protein
MKIMVKIKNIKEILPEALDYMLMNEEELYLIGQKHGELLSKEQDHKLKDSTKRDMTAGMQGGIFNMAMQAVKADNKKHYDKVMHDLRNKKGNAELDLDYVEKITAGHFMKSIKNSYACFCQGIVP